MDIKYCSNISDTFIALGAYSSAEISFPRKGAWVSARAVQDLVGFSADLDEPLDSTLKPG